MNANIARHELPSILRYKRAFLQMMVAHRSMRLGDSSATWRHRKAVAELESISDQVSAEVRDRIENSIMPLFPETKDA